MAPAEDMGDSPFGLVGVHGVGKSSTVLAVLALVWGGGVAGAVAERVAVPTPAQLQEALLTPANLPAGFQETPLPGAGINSFAPCAFAADADGTARLWTLPGGNAVTDVVFSPDGRTLAGCH
jgi:hypothetical protein